jgi:hypothetical protein
MFLQRRGQQLFGFSDTRIGHKSAGDEAIVVGSTTFSGLL